MEEVLVRAAGRVIRGDTIYKTEIDENGQEVQVPLERGSNAEREVFLRMLGALHAWQNCRCGGWQVYTGNEAPAPRLRGTWTYGLSDEGRVEVHGIEIPRPGKELLVHRGHFALLIVPYQGGEWGCQFYVYLSTVSGWAAWRSRHHLEEIVDALLEAKGQGGC